MKYKVSFEIDIPEAVTSDQLLRFMEIQIGLINRWRDDEIGSYLAAHDLNTCECCYLEVEKV